MSDAAFAAIAASNAALSAAHAAQAAEAAREAKTALCAQIMPGYTDQQATVEEKQAYAGCVAFLHPPPAGEVMTGGELLMCKILIVSAFLGGAVGMWKFWQNDHTVTDAFVGMLVGAIVPPIFIGLVCAAYWGVRFLFL